MLVDINKGSKGGELSKNDFEKTGDQLKILPGQKSYSSFDDLYHLGRAKYFYKKAISLHTAGAEYKRITGDMIYLEDDFNDTAYHFGAAYDRYMMTHGVFDKKIKHINKIIRWHDKHGL